jgi:pimeloyl-ACP methyl ester carboxylesterase
MQHIAVSNGTISVLAKGKGVPILFVHGFPFNHAMWQAQADAFAATHRVIVPDLRGFGESTVMPGTVTMEQFADDLHTLLHAANLSGPIIFCGLSMGGYIGWQFFRKYRSQLKALILCDTRAVADSPDAAAGRFKLADGVTENGAQAVVDSMLPRLFSSQTKAHRPQIIDQAEAMILRNKPAGIAAGLRGLAERPDCSDLLPKIDVPTLLICGADDSIATPAEMRGIADAIPSARFAEIPKAGHMSPMENPDAFDAAIREFLASLPNS